MSLIPKEIINFVSSLDAKSKVILAMPLVALPVIPASAAVLDQADILTVVGSWFALTLFVTSFFIYKLV